MADRFGRVWSLPDAELCPVCGQPDSCGDCNHQPLTDEQACFLDPLVVITTPPGRR